MTWQDDKAWSDRFLDEIKAICGRCFIAEPTVEEDTLRNTDLIVLKLEPVRIACRIRKLEYYERYGNQFTIRCSRPSGAETELSKVLSGWGNFLFYGFGGESRLADWGIGDLSVFRAWHAHQLVSLPPGEIPGARCVNRDGSSEFMAYNWDDMPDSFTVARMHARWIDATPQDGS